MNIGFAIKKGSKILENKNIKSSLLDAEILMSKVFKTDRSFIILNNDKNNLLNEDLKEKNVDNEIINLTYEKFDTNGNKYLIKAKKGILDNKLSNIIYMNEVEASLIYLNNERLIIYSKEAIVLVTTVPPTFILHFIAPSAESI